jgi:hypothetical protein
LGEKIYSTHGNNNSARTDARYSCEPHLNAQFVIHVSKPSVNEIDHQRLYGIVGAVETAQCG